MNERWRAIPGIPKLYLVSDRGRVFSVRRGIFLAPSQSGYIVLHVHGESIARKIDGIVDTVFPLACDCGECKSSVDCWHCGFNPAVYKERREIFKKRGLEKTENGTWGYRITKADIQKGYTKYTPREEKGNENDSE
jgi:hypothetical protein